MAMVIKKGGRLQAFSQAKIVSSIRKAGGSKAVGRRIARSVARELRGRKRVDHATIRRSVLTMLRRLDARAAHRYSAYKKRGARRVRRATRARRTHRASRTRRTARRRGASHRRTRARRRR